MKKNQEYNIGLDIGVASIGWAVTDEENNILRKSGKNMWGSRIFSEAQPASIARDFRGNRRRIRRKKERLNILKSLVQEDMDAIDENFFKRLQETNLIAEEKLFQKENKKYNLFNEVGLNDKEYYKLYPTIYHLREKLIECKEKIDFRLVYLAMHHIIKYRGNFLYENIEFKDNTGNVKDEIYKIIEFIDERYGIEVKENEVIFCEKFENILKEKNIGKIQRKQNLMSLFSYNNEQKKKINAICSAVVGAKFKIQDIFEDIDSDESFSLSDSNIEEKRENIIEKLADDSLIFENIEKIYSWHILQDILQGEEYISKAFTKKYNEYKKDLMNLKKVYINISKDLFDKMFKKEEKNNYVAYMKTINGATGKITVDELYKRIKSDLKDFEENEDVKNIYKKIEERTFLIKIRESNNGVIPYQLHYKELEKIIENQSKYYKTLEKNGKDILETMKFRIPYYVGPLSKNGNSRFSWIVRNSDEKIYPWNFDKVVNIDETAEQFIRRMTNKCTYLINKDVIPKQSLLYSEFCVRNELANIRVNHRKIGKDAKESIIENLFMKKKVVTKKNLKEYLENNQFFENVTIIEGLAEESKFISNMSSYIDMKRIFGNIDINNKNMIENIIEWITIFEDKKILRRKIKNTYSEISDEQIRQILKLKYTGWSRLSRELLLELKSYDNNQNIMEKLCNTDENFMKIINKKEYGFYKQIEENLPNIDNNIKYSDIEEIQTSPANKRAIWQCIKVVKEIVKVMKKEPKNIYIEFAREEGKKERTQKRGKQLLAKYENLTYEIKPELLKELQTRKNENFDEKLYLYFLQNGKCLYSQKKLEIDNLSLYQVDHIIPQSYVKDDSISNKALVYQSENQRKKDDLLLDIDIISKNKVWWKKLYENGLMDGKKYKNLTRTKMFETDNDKINFVNRQLVETRQITKYVTNLLVKQYNDVNVFSLKASLTAFFRNNYGLYKNRNINNCHHAQDAYIVSLIGNIIDKKLKYKDEYLYTEYVKKYFEDKKNKEENVNKKRNMVIGMIVNNVNEVDVRKVFRYKDFFVTRMLEEQNANFYDQTLFGKSSNKNMSNPLKENLDINKYGGYSREQRAYLSIYSYLDKNKNKVMNIIGIPVKISYKIKDNKITLEDYIKNKYLCGIEYSNFKIEKEKIFKYQKFIDADNCKMMFISEQEITSSKEIFLNEKIGKLVYMMNHENEKNEEVDLNFNYIYDALLDKMIKEYKNQINVAEKLKSKKDEFLKLPYEEKKIVINEIINIMERGKGNLKNLGLSVALGKKNGQNFNANRLEDIIFINQSVTGMYEERYKL